MREKSSKIAQSHEEHSKLTLIGYLSTEQWKSNSQAAKFGIESYKIEVSSRLLVSIFI